MSQKSKKANKDIETKTDEELIEEILNDEYLLSKRALIEVIHEEARKLEEKGRDYELPPASKYQKIRMNRLFRERVGGSFLPFPEEDTPYERIRSKFIIKFKINELFNRRKKRRQIK